ncbi:hypothetical protein TNCV_737511 [Trichonephila clavipes]|nr:hypothetical protein TNCV_737511 [Trichonephila clavipes]
MLMRKHVNYATDFELKVIEKATEVGSWETARLFNIDGSNIKLWRGKNKVDFENCYPKLFNYGLDEAHPRENVKNALKSATNTCRTGEEIATLHRSN